MNNRILQIISFSVLLCSCGADEKDKKKDEVKEYKVVTLQPQSVTIHTDYPATIQGEEVVEIRPRVEGYIEEVYVDEGATVKKGQLLFKISNPQYEQDYRAAQAGIKTAEANVNTAAMNVEKTRPLVEQDIISSYDLKAAEFTLQSQKAALAQAQAALSNAAANLGFTKITSPADGVIGTFAYKKGSLVNGTSASPLTTIASGKDAYAYFSLNEKQMLQFSRSFKGGTVQEQLKNMPEINLVLADGSVYSHPGRVETASGLITTATGSANFRAAFPNTEGLLRSGGSGLVRIPRTIDTGILIPQSATYELQDKKLVYLLLPDNKVISRAISVTPTDDGDFYISSGGVHPGDKLVLNGIAELKDSVTIKPAAVSPASVYSQNELHGKDEEK